MKGSVDLYVNIAAEIEGWKEHTVLMADPSVRCRHVCISKLGATIGSRQAFFRSQNLESDPPMSSRTAGQHSWSYKGVYPHGREPET